jgi:hypothetical protein
MSLVAAVFALKGLNLAHFPRSLRCGDRVRLQSYFCRASVVVSMPADDPQPEVNFINIAARKQTHKADIMVVKIGYSLS